MSKNSAKKYDYHKEEITDNSDADRPALRLIKSALNIKDDEPATSATTTTTKTISTTAHLRIVKSETNENENYNEHNNDSPALKLIKSALNIKDDQNDYQKTVTTVATETAIKSKQLSRFHLTIILLAILVPLAIALTTRYAHNYTDDLDLNNIKVRHGVKYINN
ncbi:MAG: hypothetical protein HQK49_06990 [Oligoflexia bacterium]|nr:hypothetical protein [Oligoflexia bacterium]